MKKEDIKKLAENKNFISGIYNYCDRWCERCPFTSRCLNFEMSEEKFGDLENADITNEVFWQRLSETFQETLGMLKEMAAEKGIDLDAIELEDDDDFERRFDDPSVVHLITHMANSYISYGPQWAEAGTSPFRYFKDYATQGGINTPMIISGPNVNRRDEIHHGFTSVQDLAPTFYEVAGISYPAIFKEQQVYPLKGNSLLPFISDASSNIHPEEYVFALEHHGNAMLRKGKWKITNFIRPFELENFGLYDLSIDIGEQTDLREEEPDTYEALLREWVKFSEEIKLQTPPPFPNSE